MRTIPILLFLVLVVATIAAEQRSTTAKRLSGSAEVQEAVQSDQRQTGEMLLVSVVRALVRRQLSDA